MNVRIAAFALVLFAPLAARADCDCREIVGQCIGLVEVVRSFGAEPSYGAELLVHSSEKQCSKVEYYIDSTPHQTVLVNRQKEPESVFGTKPITAANVSFSRCVVCATTGQASAAKGSSAVRIASDSDIAGEWRGSLSGQNAGPMTVRFSLAGGSLTGEMYMDGKTFRVTSASVSGDRISWVQPFVFGNVRWSGTLDRAAGTIRGEWTHPLNSDAFELTKAP